MKIKIASLVLFQLLFLLELSAKHATIINFNVSSDEYKEYFNVIRVGKSGTVKITSPSDDSIIQLCNLSFSDFFTKSFAFINIHIADTTGSAELWVRSYSADDSIIEIIRLNKQVTSEIINVNESKHFLYQDLENPASRVSLEIHYNPNISKTREVGYDIKIKSAIFPVKTLVYIIISCFFSIIMWHLLSYKRFNRLCSVSWNRYFTNAVAIVSSVFIGILLIDEIGLLLQEWGLPTGFFSLSRQFIGNPGVMQLLYLANLGLMIPATYIISKESIEYHLNSFKFNKVKNTIDIKNYQHKYATFSALFMVCISVVFFLLQCLVWNEFGDEYTLYSSKSIFFSLIIVLIILIPPAILLAQAATLNSKLNKYENPLRKSTWFGKTQLISILLILFLSLTQTMITRIILLIALIRWFTPQIRKIISIFNRGLKLADSISEKGKKSTNEVFFLNSTSVWDLWNFFFLTTSTLILLLIYQSTASPYPPTDNAYPKSETISFFYMAYILAFLIPIKRLKWVKSILWTSFTIFCLYGLPLFFPSFFFPALRQPGVSIIESLIGISSIYSMIAFFLILHLMLAFMFIYLWYRQELKQRIIEGNTITDFQLFQLTGGIILPSKIFYLIIFSVVILFVSTSYLPAFTEIRPWLKGEVLLAVMILLIILAVLLLTLLDERETKELREEMAEIGGEPLIERITKQVKVLKVFKAWNPQRNIRHIIYYYGLIFLVFSVSFFACAIIPKLFSKKQAGILVWNQLYEKEIYSIKFFLKTNSIFYVGYDDRIVAYDKFSGKIIWKVNTFINQARLFDSTCVFIYTTGEALAVDFNRMDTLWRTKINYNPKEEGNTIVNLFPDYISLAQGDEKNRDIIVLDIKTGNLIAEQNQTIPLHRDYGKSTLFCKTQGNKFKILDSQFQWIDLTNLNDTIIMGNYSFGNHIFIVTPHNLVCYNNNGKMCWRYPLNEKEYIEDITIYGSKVFIQFSEIKKGIICLELETGKEMWHKKGYQRIKFYENSFDVLGFKEWKPLHNSLQVFSEGNLDFLNLSTGENIKRFSLRKGANTDAFIIGDSLFAFQDELLLIFSVKNNSIISKIRYKKAIVDAEQGRYKNETALQKLILISAFYEKNILYLVTLDGLFAVNLAH